MIPHTIKLLIISIILLLSSNSVYAAINYTLTPLKYEIEAQQGDVITRVAQITNNGNETVTLPTGTSDFQATDATGTPNFVRKSELVFADQQLSSWITIDTPSVTLAPGETKGFSFDINVPLRAPPGGHYGAVFFKNPGSETSTSGNIGINVDYGILILLNVAGEIVVDIVVDGVIIGQETRSARSSGGGGTGSSRRNSGNTDQDDGDDGDNSDDSISVGIDDCRFGDLTASNFDGKCIDNPFSFGEDDNDLDGEDLIIEENSNSPNSQNLATESTVGADLGLPDSDDSQGANGIDSGNPLDSFEVSFTLPINNNGNTHVKPQGKIKLVDEDGKTIKGVGKEIQKNEFGAVTGEKIVDYLPLNDEGGNVLPKTKRNFESTWKGFPHKTYDDAGNQVIDYWKPGEYYTNQNLAENRFQKPWERVNEKRKTKTVQAVIELAYEDADGELIEYNSAEEFEIEYTEQYIGLNPYLLIPFFSFIGFLFLWWIIAAKRKVPCLNKECKEKLKRKTKRCPKCDTLQQEKKKKSKKVAITKKAKTDKKKKKKSKDKKTKK